LATENPNIVADRYARDAILLPTVSGTYQFELAVDFLCAHWHGLLTFPFF
jgi:hypothetical protein